MNYDFILLERIVNCKCCTALDSIEGAHDYISLVDHVFISFKEAEQNAELNERIERLSDSDRKHILEVIDLLIKQTGNE